MVNNNYKDSEWEVVDDITWSDEHCAGTVNVQVETYERVGDFDNAYWATRNDILWYPADSCCGSTNDPAFMTTSTSEHRWNNYDNDSPDMIDYDRTDNTDGDNVNLEVGYGGASIGWEETLGGACSELSGDGTDMEWWTCYNSRHSYECSMCYGSEDPVKQATGSVVSSDYHPDDDEHHLLNTVYSGYTTCCEHCRDEYKHDKWVEIYSHA